MYNCAIDKIVHRRETFAALINLVFVFSESSSSTNLFISCFLVQSWKQTEEPRFLLCAIMPRLKTWIAPISILHFPRAVEGSAAKVFPERTCSYLLADNRIIWRKLVFSSACMFLFFLRYLSSSVLASLKITNKTKWQNLERSFY